MESRNLDQIICPLKAKDFKTIHIPEMLSIPNLYNYEMTSNLSQAQIHNGADLQQLILIPPEQTLHIQDQPPERPKPQSKVQALKDLLFLKHFKLELDPQQALNP